MKHTMTWQLMGANFINKDIFFNNSTLAALQLFLSSAPSSVHKVALSVEFFWFRSISICELLLFYVKNKSMAYFWFLIINYNLILITFSWCNICPKKYLTQVVLKVWACSLKWIFLQFFPFAFYTQYKSCLKYQSILFTFLHHF